MNSMPFRQLKSFLKILIGVQYEICLSLNAAFNQGYQLQHTAEALGLLLLRPRQLSLPAGIAAVEHLQVEGGQGPLGQTRLRRGQPFR